ncbi:MAG TPA: tetratricopeptide repeat protein, partial [Gemmataceae bacterium]|nr:tetratricopeptide repeat protein [Gemmataceae bacterium]
MPPGGRDGAIPGRPQGLFPFCTPFSPPKWEPPGIALQSPSHLLNQGDREGSLPYLQRAADRGSRSGDGNDAPRLLLAETLLALGRGDEAEPHLQGVLARHPDDPRARYDMGLLLAD